MAPGPDWGNPFSMARTQSPHQSFEQYIVAGSGISLTAFTSCENQQGSTDVKPVRNYIAPQELKEGDIVLIDGGCKVEGYQADITRTTVFGEASTRQTEIWNVVKDAQSKVYEQAKPGIACERLDAVARKVVAEAGFGKGYANFVHRVGHGIGMDFHEWTYLVKGNKTLLEPGMCFSNEPGIYLYEEFGVRHEDCFYITEQGYEAFTPQSLSIDNPIG